jgi:hypothetical protein
MIFETLGAGKVEWISNTILLEITFSFAGMIRIRFKGFDLSLEGTPKVHVFHLNTK